ncbi:uncharacterized protein LOC120326115 [Styela clava]
MSLALNSLKEQIEKAKENLKSVDENIKKITGRDPNEPRPNIENRRLSGGASRNRETGNILGRRERDVQTSKIQDSEPPRKKLAVFSRLGPAGGGRRVIIRGRRKSKQEEEDEEEEEIVKKPAVQSSVVSTAKKITKNELISAQNVGEKGKARNRRMFGVLMGTLARFQNDSGSQRQQTLKQTQKQREVETRLEEQTIEERRKLASQRRTLFNERRAQQKRIQLLEQKVALADELVEWEKEWDKKSKFIMTKASPKIFFMPKDLTPRTQRALEESKEQIRDIVEKHRESVGETMNIFDAEIKMLEGKLEDENGKGKDLRKNREGGGTKSPIRKRGVRITVPLEHEEEMDLDSMGPQVDIKVEMDDHEEEVSDGGEEGVTNGETMHIKQEPVGAHQSPESQNHEEAMEEETGTLLESKQQVEGMDSQNLEDDIITGDINDKVITSAEEKENALPDSEDMSEVNVEQQGASSCETEEQIEPSTKYQENNSPSSNQSSNSRNDVNSAVDKEDNNGSGQKLKEIEEFENNVNESKKEKTKLKNGCNDNEENQRSPVSVGEDKKDVKPGQEKSSDSCDVDSTTKLSSSGDEMKPSHETKRQEHSSSSESETARKLETRVNVSKAAKLQTKDSLGSGKALKHQKSDKAPERKPLSERKHVRKSSSSSSSESDSESEKGKTKSTRKPKPQTSSSSSDSSSEDKHRRLKNRQFSSKQQSPPKRNIRSKPKSSESGSSDESSSSEEDRRRKSSSHSRRKDDDRKSKHSRSKREVSRKSSRSSHRRSRSRSTDRKDRRRR